MVSYEAMTETVFGLIELTKTSSADRYLSYLPISHGMERWVGQCVPYVSGMQIFYAEALTTFVADLNRCRPTLFVSVPRLWTKVGEAISYAAKPEAAIRNSTFLRAIFSKTFSSSRVSSRRCRLRSWRSYSRSLSLASL